MPRFSKAPAAQSPCPYPKMLSPEAPSRGPVRDESMGIAQRSRTGPFQNLRPKPNFRFDVAPFSKIGELNAPDPSRSRVLSTSGPEKRGFARDIQKKGTRTHRPKANTNPLYIELELVEKNGALIPLGFGYSVWPFKKWYLAFVSALHFTNKLRVQPQKICVLNAADE